VVNKPENLAKLSSTLDVLLVCGSGSSTDWGALLNLLDNHGKLVMLDLPEKPMTFSPVALIYKHLSVVGSFVGSNNDLAEMLDLASKANVRPMIEKVGNTSEEVNKGIDKLISGKVRYRVVICGKGRA
jgi:D-arabinose 1-dehydrogenase-like Zn-dependent alcohol dehydrogenase